jgi:spermidine/putrescine transport system ATP-binding protein
MMATAGPRADAAPAAVRGGDRPAVELRGVTKRFGATTALDNIDLVIGKGEFFALLGPSGCGKTTTLNLIGGFESTSSGTLLIDGKPVQDIPAHARPVNTVFQSYALFPHMSVVDNVEFGLRMKKVPKEERRRAALEMLKMVSLAGFEERRPSQLSGGQRQRVALARALVNQPAVLLLDEPLGALDLKLRKQMQLELTRLQRQVGITFVYVTHDQEEALAMSDRIAVMDHGRILQIGTPAEIYGAPANRGVMEFIGSVNAFEGRVASLESGRATVAIDGAGPVSAHADGPAAVGDRVAVLVRPERIRMSATAPPAGALPLSGTLEKIAPLGFVTHCTVLLSNGSEVLVFRLNNPDGSGSETFAEGQRVFLWWEHTDGRMFPANTRIDSFGTPQVASPLGRPT